MNNQKEIRDFIVSNFLYGEAGSLVDDTSFLETGIIDSTGILELLAFLEKRFEIAVQEGEMVPENLDSINRLTQFVERKLGQDAAAKL